MGKKINRKYKDRFFRFLFGSEERKEYTLSLYNALNGSAYTKAEDLELTTIDDVIYMGMKNDISFIIDDEMYLFEHQSTYNPNMPVRGLIYFGRLYNNYIETNELEIYSTRLLRLPKPRYIVFYNGDRRIEGRKVLKLSDSFGGVCDVEVVATMIDINCDSKDDILDRCPMLKDYAVFIGKVKKNESTGMNMKEAVARAVDDCIEEEILSDILISHKSEVLDMVLTEYDPKRHERNVYAEGRLKVLTDIMDGRGIGFDEACREAFVNDSDRELLRSLYEEQI